MIKNNPLLEQSKKLAIEIIGIHKYLQLSQKEFDISKQLYRSGTSVGANSTEAVYATSRKDFFNKCSIALKEASETAYWLEILHETGYINDIQFTSAYKYCKECIAILVKTMQKRNKNTDDDINPGEIEI